MKRKIIILIVIIILGILGLIFIPRVYYATLFVHKDLNKIKLEPIEIYSDHMKYDGWSYSDNKDYKFPRYCYVYYAAKIKFPEEDIIIATTKNLLNIIYLFSVFYRVNSISHRFVLFCDLMLIFN